MLESPGKEVRATRTVEDSAIAFIFAASSFETSLSLISCRTTQIACAALIAVVFVVFLKYAVAFLAWSLSAFCGTHEHVLREEQLLRAGYYRDDLVSRAAVSGPTIVGEAVVSEKAAMETRVAADLAPVWMEVDSIRDDLHTIRDMPTHGGSLHAWRLAVFALFIPVAFIRVLFIFAATVVKATMHAIEWMFSYRPVRTGLALQALLSWGAIGALWLWVLHHSVDILRALGPLGLTVRHLFYACR